MASRDEYRIFSRVIFKTALRKYMLGKPEMGNKNYYKRGPFGWEMGLYIIRVQHPSPV